MNENDALKIRYVDFLEETKKINKAIIADETKKMAVLVACSGHGVLSVAGDGVCGSERRLCQMGKRQFHHRIHHL